MSNTPRQNFKIAYENAGNITDDFFGRWDETFEEVYETSDGFVLICDNEGNTDEDYSVTYFKTDFCGNSLFEGSLSKCKKFAKELVKSKK